MWEAIVEIMKKRLSVCLVLLCLGLFFLIYALREEVSHPGDVHVSSASELESDSNTRMMQALAHSGMDESVSELGDVSIESLNTVQHEEVVSPVLRATEGGSLTRKLAGLPRGRAALSIGERNLEPKNLTGHYQRVLLSEEKEAAVSVTWAGVGKRAVVVHAIHGGKIDGKIGAQTLYTDESGQLAFNFEANDNIGRYEILLRSGPTEEVLHFWVSSGNPKVDLYGL